MRANLRDDGKSLGECAAAKRCCCLRRMGCGRIFGHMRFEALGSRSSRLWMRTHRRRVFITSPLAAVLMPSLSSWNENQVLSKLLKTVQIR